MNNLSIFCLLKRNKYRKVNQIEYRTDRRRSVDNRKRCWEYLSPLRVNISLIRVSQHCYQIYSFVLCLVNPIKSSFFSSCSLVGLSLSLNYFTMQSINRELNNVSEENERSFKMERYCERRPSTQCVATINSST